MVWDFLKLSHMLLYMHASSLLCFVWQLLALFSYLSLLLLAFYRHYFGLYVACEGSSSSMSSLMSFYKLL